ncbi:hypothetical protein [Gordoniibacillus kamchatkensis]|uniref:hypothetical protein n=1 Tax=Gordoniibacillus kamchatkensis TaxID=1590651 RepID=UPI00069696CB|nr:hypothetical protein [Paenibacillus sp. VKM B-2647]
MQSLWWQGIIPQLMKSDEPLHIFSITEIGLNDRVAISIRKDGEVLGYIWAIEINNRLDSTGLELLKKAEQIAKQKLLQIQNRKRKQEEGFREFFWQLLFGHLTSSDAIKEKAE